MSKAQAKRLDRLFPRQAGHGIWLGVRDAWDPPWCPRGRWWMRARGPGGHTAVERSTHAWMRLTRPGRAA